MLKSFRGTKLPLPLALSFRYLTACLPSSWDSTIIYCSLSAKTASTACSYLESTWMTSATRPMMCPSRRGTRSVAFIIVLTPILYPSKFSVRAFRLENRDWHTLSSDSADLNSTSIRFFISSSSSEFISCCLMEASISCSLSAVASLARLFLSEARTMFSIFALMSLISFSRRDWLSVIWLRILFRYPDSWFSPTSLLAPALNSALAFSKSSFIPFNNSRLALSLFSLSEISSSSSRKCSFIFSIFRSRFALSPSSPVSRVFISSCSPLSRPSSSSCILISLFSDSRPVSFLWTFSPKSKWIFLRLDSSASFSSSSRSMVSILAWCLENSVDFAISCWTRSSEDLSLSPDSSFNWW